MGLKILHTSDIHLGMKFAAYPEVQSELSEARFNTLTKLVELANNEECNLFVIAGDLFHHVAVAKRDVVRTAHILKEFEGRLVVILPGNHDFISLGQNDLWSHFKYNSGDNVLLLEEMRVYPLGHYDLDVNLYPAPCYSKHSPENHIGWIKEAEKDKAVKHHIGIAHGSLEGFSPDFDKRYYPMNVSELEECGLDLWLMGHTHIPYPERPGEMDKIYYASTPEPDCFDCKHEGKAWIFAIGDDKSIKPELISTGTYRFLHDEVEVSKSSDIDKLQSKYARGEYSRTLLKLKLKGRLHKEDYKSLPEVKKALEKQLFYLRFDDSEITERLTPEDINRAFTEGSFPHRLLTELAKINDLEALQVAYEIMMGSRS